MATIGPKLYFHDATTTNTGTLPGGTDNSGQTPAVTATGASTNRVLNDVIGTGQVSVAITSSATTSVQRNWFRRFMTAPLAAQTIATTPWTSGGAMSMSNTNSNFQPYCYCIYTWRPGTGAIVTTMYDAMFGLLMGPATTPTVETWATNGFDATLTTASTISDGDVLVVEVWGHQTQSKATAYTNTWWYDGTTEGSSTNAASYINLPAALTLYTAPAAGIPDIAMARTRS